MAIELNWTAAEWEAGPRVERYQVLKEVDDTFILIGTVTLEYSFIMELLGPPLTFVDTDVVDGETYRYKVLAVASTGQSLRSNVFTITAGPVESLLLQEDLTPLLQEDGEGILIEEATVSVLLQEDAFRILQEDGGRLVLTT